MSRTSQHTWQDCYPMIGNDPQNETNKRIRRIMRRLSQSDRIKVHQANCLGQMSPIHMAVVNKIRKQLEEAGVKQVSGDLQAIVLVTPADMAKNWPLPTPNPVTVQHSPSTCNRCGADAWIGPQQKALADSVKAERVCIRCYSQDPELRDTKQTPLTFVNPDIDNQPRRF